jgi:hypothetical protein
MGAIGRSLCATVCASHGLIQSISRKPSTRAMSSYIVAVDGFANVVGVAGGPGQCFDHVARDPAHRPGVDVFAMPGDDTSLSLGGRPLKSTSCSPRLHVDCPDTVKGIGKSTTSNNNGGWRDDCDQGLPDACSGTEACCWT